VGCGASQRVEAFVEQRECLHSNHGQVPMVAGEVEAQPMLLVGGASASTPDHWQLDECQWLDHYSPAAARRQPRAMREIG
jgi:hypothetical protein